jgi:hypothetical protein
MINRYKEQEHEQGKKGKEKNIPQEDKVNPIHGLLYTPFPVLWQKKQDEGMVFLFFPMLFLFSRVNFAPFLFIFQLSACGTLKPKIS